MKYRRKLLVSNISHNEIIVCNRKFTIVNTLGGILYQEIKTITSTYKVLIKLWQRIYEDVIKWNTLLYSANILENFLKILLLCHLMSAFAKFQKFWPSLARYSTLESPSFMLCQNLIKTF